MNFKTFACSKMNEVPAIIKVRVFTVNKQPSFEFNLSMVPSPETTATKFVVTPSNPSYAVEGQEFLLEWTYTLSGGVGLVQFFNVSGSGTDSIGARFGPGVISSTPKYAARFRAQATNTTAELRILAVQISDEATYRLNLISSDTMAISNDVKVIVWCKY